MSAGPVKHLYIPQSNSPGTFTGERLTSGIGGDVELEHWHRYMMAQLFCEGCDVIDIACGEGYGSAYLARTARTVTGIDIDKDVVEKARQDFPSQNLSFVQGCAKEIPCETDSADVIVSMETLEHFTEHEMFFSEAVRVLRSKGTLILSTPDAEIYSGPFQPVNPYHKRELFRAEFEQIVNRHFSSSVFLGQFSVNGNVIASLTRNSGEAILFNQGYGPRFEMFNAGFRSKYVIAIATNGQLPEIPVFMLNGAHHHATRSLQCDHSVEENLRLRSENAILKEALKLANK